MLFGLLLSEGTGSSDECFMDCRMQLFSAAVVAYRNSHQKVENNEPR